MRKLEARTRHRRDTVSLDPQVVMVEPTRMKTITDIRKAKAHLSRIVDDVGAGAEVVITKAGKPVARLVPLE